MNFLYLLILFVFPGFGKVVAVFPDKGGSRNESPNGSSDASPEIFGDGIISTPDDEFGITFTPDAQTCYFAKKTPSTLSGSTIVICYSVFKEGRWTRPEIAPFSGRYKDFNPSVSPDGKQLFFISNRPDKDKTKPDTDIWVVERTDTGWSAPHRLGSPVNSPAWELGCSVSRSGTLYFSSTRDSGNLDIYRSVRVNGNYQEPEKLSGAINTPFNETDPFIDPDEKFILFSSRGRPDAIEGAGAPYPRSDIYISYQKEGKWDTARNLGVPVNSIAEETNPVLSPDGTTLYFTSERNFITIPMKDKLTYASLEEHLHRTGNGLGDIYQVPFPGAGKSPARAKPHAASKSPAPAKPHAAGKPELFGEGIISTPDDEFGGSLTPDGRTCYFSKSVPRSYFYTICFSTFRQGKWNTPEIAPFSGVYRDFDPVLSPDGSILLFSSDRPVHGEVKSDYDIWMVKRIKDQGNGAFHWSDPIHLDSPINTSYNEHFASIASNGTIYFSSDRPGALGGPGDADLYRCRLLGGKYSIAEHLLDSVSSGAYELDCVIAPDEDFLLIGSYGRPDGYGNYDIYISRKIKGKFTASRNLGPLVNTKYRDYSPRISPDGKFLFFTSERDFADSGAQGVKNYDELEKGLHGVLNGSGNIYRVELAALGVGLLFRHHIEK